MPLVVYNGNVPDNVCHRRAETRQAWTLASVAEERTQFGSWLLSTILFCLALSIL